MAARKTFLLRIDPALWAELEAWAQGELRSVNGPIEHVPGQRWVPGASCPVRSTYSTYDPG